MLEHEADLRITPRRDAARWCVGAERTWHWKVSSSIRTVVPEAPPSIVGG